MDDETTTYRFKNKQPTVWYHRTLKRSNQWCLYCSRFLGDGIVKSDREHLIGRSFVPDGSFGTGQAFNFIFRACTDCNDEKADIERHLSTMTLITSSARSDSTDVNELAERKASKDYHPNENGKLVSEIDSRTSIEIKSAFGRANIGFVGPPQPDPSCVKVLAFRHVQGFFSLVTSKDPLRADGTRILTPKNWWYGGYFPHSDWGNSWLIEIARRVRSWNTCVNAVTAGGFFKAVLKKDVAESGDWIWALEWNKSLRVIGGIAHPDITPTVFRDLPDIGWQVVEPGTRMRKERALSEDDDDLFEETK